MAAAAAAAVRVSHIYDAADIKRVLDERAAQAVVDAGYVEDLYVSNVKIGLGLLTCATALVAQFYPTPFPENYPLLIACIAVYFVLNTALQAFVYLYEGETVLKTHGKVVRETRPCGLFFFSLCFVAAGRWPRAFLQPAPLLGRVHAHASCERR